MDKLKSLTAVVLFAALLLTFSVLCFFTPAAAPELSAKSLFSGAYMRSFERDAAECFPLRDAFRSLKAFTALHIFRSREVNGIYRNAEGYLSKLEYPLDETSLQNAADKFAGIQQKYLGGEDVKVYFSVIPDKNYFMAADCGVLSMDYARLTEYLTARLPNMRYIDIFDRLTLEDYYKTDTHWRQEKITDVAETLATGMGASLNGDYRTDALDTPFYGVYAGQFALNAEGETLRYLRSGLLDRCTVYDVETDSKIGIYDMEKARGRDPYELFLSGSKSILKITNPAAENQRRLVIFRDSFGSSLAPLLVPAYAEVDVVDIRYLSPALLDRFLTFENCDVLFIYSTLVLNNSITLK